MVSKAQFFSNLSFFILGTWPYLVCYFFLSFLLLFLLLFRFDICRSFSFYSQFCYFYTLLILDFISASSVPSLSKFIPVYLFVHLASCNCFIIIIDESQISLFLIDFLTSFPTFSFSFRGIYSGSSLSLLHVT